MKINRTIKLLVFLIVALLPFTSIYAQSNIPQSLRQGVSVDEATINIALEMQTQGWKYIMPQPKSPQACWGNTDGRTTWYIGYWKNIKTNESSLAQPIKKDNKYVGDNNGAPAWRRGGSPAAPTKIEWLLSVSGGIQPYN